MLPKIQTKNKSRKKKKNKRKQSTMKHLKVQVKMSSAVVHSNRLPHRFRIKKKEQNKIWLTFKSKKEWRSKEEKKGKLLRRRK